MEQTRVTTPDTHITLAQQVDEVFAGSPDVLFLNDVESSFSAAGQSSHEDLEAFARSYQQVMMGAALIAMKWRGQDAATEANRKAVFENVAMSVAAVDATVQTLTMPSPLELALIRGESYDPDDDGGEDEEDDEDRERDRVRALVA